MPIANNITTLNSSIKQAIIDKSHSITLLAVSKTHPVSAIEHVNMPIMPACANLAKTICKMLLRKLTSLNI